MKLKRMKLKDLAPAPYNPRKISPEALAGLRKSIEEFGLVEPIVYNTKTQRVIGGHQRLKVLMEMGEKETDVVMVDLDEKKEKALNIALNNPHIAGEFTDDLKIILEDIKFEMPDLFLSLKLDNLLKTSISKDYTIEDLVIDVNMPLPCWFVIRGDIRDYEQIKYAIEKLSKKIKIQMEDSGDQRT
jgi:hypothetical protein